MVLRKSNENIARLKLNEFSEVRHKKPQTHSVIVPGNYSTGLADCMSKDSAPDVPTSACPQFPWQAFWVTYQGVKMTMHSGESRDKPISKVGRKAILKLLIASGECTPHNFQN